MTRGMSSTSVSVIYCNFVGCKSWLILAFTGQIVYHLSMIRLFGPTLRPVAYSWLLLYAFQTFVERENRKRKIFIHVACSILLLAAVVGAGNIQSTLQKFDL